MSVPIHKTGAMVAMVAMHQRPVWPEPDASSQAPPSSLMERRIEPR